MQKAPSSRARTLLLQRTVIVLFLAIIGTATWLHPVSAFAPQRSNNNVQKAAAVLIETVRVQERLMRKQPQTGGGWNGAAAAAAGNNKPVRTVLEATVVESESIEETSSSSSNNNNSSSTVTVTAVVEKTAPVNGKEGTIELLDKEARMLAEMEAQAASIVDEMMEEVCEVDETTGGPKDELCVDEVKRSGFRATMKGYVKSMIGSLRQSISSTTADVEEEAVETKTPTERLTGDELERGCE